MKHNVRNQAHERPPLRWTGVLFAFAANMLLVTVTSSLVPTLQLSPEFEIVATLIAPLLAGVLTTLYVQQRGSMHAFLGGMLSIPVLAIFIFDGMWQLAIFAGCFCTLGGTVAEIVLRRMRR